MTNEDVQFCLPVERGPLEARALLLCESIPALCGRYRDAPITAISPRANARPADGVGARVGESRRLLDARHNLPLHHADRLPDMPAAPVHIHYHWLFEPRGQAEPAPAAILAPQSQAGRWLDARLPPDDRHDRFVLREPPNDPPAAGGPSQAADR